jgi:hypothetical protein
MLEQSTLTFSSIIRWIIKQGSLCLIYCPTEDMVANTLTKALPSAKVKHFGAQLGQLPA